MDAPRLDKRKHADIVAETEALAQAYSGWRPRPDGAPDAGRALIKIFGRYAELIIDRLNRVPEKNFLAFLNLIGTELLPPQPARAPMTFRLAENSPVDALVPAGTQAAAPPLEGEEDEVVFETERDLVVTRSQLQVVFVRDTDNDRYSDRSREALEGQGGPWAAFRGDQPTPHELYIACDEVLAKPGDKEITLIMRSPDTWHWASWPFEWSYLDGETWQTATPTKSEVNQGAWRVTFGRLRPLEPHAVNGVEAGWLRAQLALSMPAAKADLVPDSVASGDANPQDLSLPYFPFGEVASVTRFYLSADEAFRIGGAVVRIRCKLSRPGKATGLRVKWSFQKTAGEWVELGQSGPGAKSSGSTAFGFSDDTEALTKDGEVSFRVPLDWERVLYRTRTGRWLRLDIVEGQYSSTPQIGALTVSYEWQTPRITGISVIQTSAPLPQVPDMAFFNASAIDLSKDYYPLGEQPRYNDALYLACEEVLARPAGNIRFKLTLTNPVGASNPPVPAVKTEGSPTIAWEVWNGRTWQELKRYSIAKDAKTGTASTLTGSEEVTLARPADMAAVVVNGELKHWLRARLVGGDYGQAAYYDDKDKIKIGDSQVTVYKPIAATYAPPMVASIEFIPDTGTGSKEVPVSACFSYNDFVYRDHGAAGAAPFPPFRVAEDTRPALYLGFDQAFDQRPTTLYLQVEPPQPHEVAAEKLAEVDPDSLAQLTWEYASPASPTGWMPLGALDETQTLAQRGLVQFIGPKDFEARLLFGQRLYWLRARWLRGEFPLPPSLRAVSLNTTWATQVTTSQEENLGSSNGNAGQTFQTAQAPVLPGQTLEVREPEIPSAAEVEALEREAGGGAINVTLDIAGQPEEIWVRWQAVADFYASGPGDRHYTIDALSGVIRFGDGYQGRVPAPGQNNIRLTYRTGGGEQGNRAAGSIVQLKSSVPYVDGVINNEPAAGGAARESLQRVQERGPRRLRHRDRSVTAQDLEDLAFEADPSVARARAIVPTFSPYNLWLDPTTPTPDLREHEQADAGRMGVILVPMGDAKRPTSTLSQLRRVRNHLVSRCSLTADLWVAGPEWVEVTVAARVIPVSVAVADVVGGRITAALDAFLHPLTGGPERTGWAFGRVPHQSDLYAVIEAVEGVDHVHALTLKNEPQIAVTSAADETLQIAVRKALNQSLTDAVGQQPEPAVQRWLSRSLVYSGRHDIRLTLEGS